MSFIVIDREAGRSVQSYPTMEAAKASVKGNEDLFYVVRECNKKVWLTGPKTQRDRCELAKGHEGACITFFIPTVLK